MRSNRKEEKNDGYYKLTYRPFEVQGEGDGVEVDHVVPHDGREALAEGAGVAGVDGLLEMLEADAELGRASSRALAGLGAVAVAAVAGTVAPEFVFEALQPKLKGSLAGAGTLQTKKDVS